MKSYPSWDQVKDALGDKVIASIGTAVAASRPELADYRRAFPSWVAAHTERGLAGWIHDRIWFHLAGTLDGVSDVTVIDKEPHREIWVGYSYRLRIKRHHDDGHVSTYRTSEALDFLTQVPVQPEFDGLEEMHLIAGYIWDKETRQIGPAVVSLRDGDNVLWIQELVEIPDEGTGTGTVSITPQTPTPSGPQIGELKRPDAKEGTESR